MSGCPWIELLKRYDQKVGKLPPSADLVTVAWSMWMSGSFSEEDQTALLRFLCGQCGATVAMNYEGKIRVSGGECGRAFSSLAQLVAHREMVESGAE